MSSAVQAKSSSSRADFSPAASAPPPLTLSERVFDATVLSNIFDRLDYQDLLASTTVSKHWHSIATLPDQAFANRWARLLCRHFCMLPEVYLSQMCVMEKQRTSGILEEAGQIQECLNATKSFVARLQEKDRKLTVKLATIQNKGNALLQAQNDLRKTILSINNEELNQHDAHVPEVQHFIQEHTERDMAAISTKRKELKKILEKQTLDLQNYQNQLTELQKTIEKIYENLCKHPWRTFVQNMHRFEVAFREDVEQVPASKAWRLLTNSVKISNPAQTITCEYSRPGKECTITAPAFLAQPLHKRFCDSIESVLVDDQGVHILDRAENIHYFDATSQEISSYLNTSDLASLELDPRGHFSLIKSHNNYIYAKITKMALTTLYCVIVDENGRRSSRYRVFPNDLPEEVTDIIPTITKIKGGVSVRVEFVSSASEQPNDLLYTFYFSRPRQSFEKIHANPSLAKDYAIFPISPSLAIARISLLDRAASDFVLATLTKVRSNRLMPPAKTEPTTKTPNTYTQQEVHNGSTLLNHYIDVLENNDEVHPNPNRLQNEDIQGAVQELFARTTAPFVLKIKNAPNLLQE